MKNDALASEFMHLLKRLMLVSLLLVWAAGVSSTSFAGDVIDGDLLTDDMEVSTFFEEDVNRDPFERVNRSVYRFNERLDRAVLRPVTVRYVRHVPPKVRRGVRNFVYNLREPTTIVNNLLQGKVTDAASDTMRFLLNTTFGLVGIFDVATHLGLERNREDFGQTLGKWGVPPGPYLVLPLLGPSTVRDATGLVPQYLYTDLAASIEDDALMWTVFAARAVDTRASLLNAEAVLEEQIDPYSFLREIYFQRRLIEVYDGAPPQQEDQYLEEFFNETQ
jgi:phospholipid-binding lipoprotein MlaA